MMAKYLLKRILESCVTILLIVCVVFLLMRLMPVDYFFTEDELMKLTPQQRLDRLDAAGMLDHPFIQLGRFLKGLFTEFDLGISRRIQTGKPVLTVIGSKFGISMRLGLIALGLALITGVPMGIMQARFKDGLIDGVGQAFTIFINSVPALVSYSLVLVFGARLLGLPSTYSARKAWKFMMFGQQFKFNYSTLLPIFCLALSSIASYMMWMRRYMVDELNKDYIRLAKLKGLSTTRVMFTHVLKNAFLPLAQYLPYSVLLAVGGSILVERFFSVPGLGPLLTDAISRYDVNVVQAIVMLYATLGILGLFLGDLLMTLLDPRIKLTGKEETR